MPVASIRRLNSARQLCVLLLLVGAILFGRPHPAQAHAVQIVPVPVTPAAPADGLTVSAGGPYFGAVDQPVTFQGAVTDPPAGVTLLYFWNFGDGSGGQGQTVRHTYAARSLYGVSLRVRASNGQTGTDDTTARVRDPLSVAAGGPYEGAVSQPVVMTATARGGSGSYNFIWDFGDGTSGGTGRSVVHAYSRAGSFTVTVVVTDNESGNNASDTTTASITSAFTLSAGGPYLGIVGQPVAMAASGTNLPFDTVFSWDFGDGGRGQGQAVVHRYATDGVFTVIVVARSQSAGQSLTDSTTATITTGVLSVSAGGPYTGRTGQAVTFTATGSNLPPDTTFSWNFGDGTNGTGMSTTHTYTAAGTYNVTVTAASAATGQSASDSTTAAITSSGFTVDAGGPYTGTANQPLKFAATGVNLPPDIAFAWTFGDGTGTAQGQSVAHIYTSSGMFTAQVSASSPSLHQVVIAFARVTINPATGTTVTYAAGWNLVSGPDGMRFTQALGPLYTFQAGDTNYEPLPNGSPVVGGRGYWAYFRAQTTVTLAGTSNSTASVTAPPNQWVMIGNPSLTDVALVSGADQVLTYDPATGSYTPATSLSVGQGAWARSTHGGAITIVAGPPPPPPR